MNALVLAMWVLAASPEAESRGWVGVGGRNAFGPPSRIDADFGVGAFGGTWLLNEHLQPMLQAGWSLALGDEFVIDLARIGFGLGAGAAILDGRLWLGGVFWARVVGSLAHGGVAVTTRNATGVEFALNALVQGRLWNRLLLGIEFGPELVIPPLGYSGGSQTRDLGPFRFNAGLRLGVIFNR